MNNDNKYDQNKLTNEVLLADVMIRVTALEKLLIKKGIVSIEELNEEIDMVANQVTDAMLKSVKDALVPSIDELIENLSSKKTVKN